MKNQSLKRKYMGSDWYFVPDTEFPKTVRLQPLKLDEIEEKFTNIQVETYRNEKKLSRNLSENSFQMQKSKIIQNPSEQNAKVSARYRNPWYIHPKYWQQLALIPEKNTDFLKSRAKNLYYFLHKSQPNLKDPLRKSSIRNNHYDLLYSESQNKLAGLSTVHNYKKYLENKKLRVPACLESLQEE
ncbi:hypothetical protein SteCoe_383 [Stentor coeruleus]|uniref:Uncharacterized protein n=1 Tax=Stentor coeruleus TaxID=5963 RepID=A0A1R2D418_9CILI|nr:hypothetical protein SteCoe_383 [Stentor coeruleus]